MSKMAATVSTDSMLTICRHHIICRFRQRIGVLMAGDIAIIRRLRTRTIDTVPSRQSLMMTAVIAVTSTSRHRIGGR